ncbi:hypothetical protein D3C81_1722380 [compost metagenome]
MESGGSSPPRQRCARVEMSSNHLSGRNRNEAYRNRHGHRQACLPIACSQPGHRRSGASQTQARPAPGFLCETRAFLGGDGSLWRRTSLGQATAGAWSRRQADLRALSPAVRVAQQDRCHRRSRHLDSGSATRCTLCRHQERGSTSDPRAASPARPTNEVPHHADQCATRSAP